MCAVAAAVFATLWYVGSRTPRHIGESVGYGRPEYSSFLSELTAVRRSTAVTDDTVFFYDPTKKIFNVSDKAGTLDYGRRKCNEKSK